jgi:hypothetical protein
MNIVGWLIGKLNGWKTIIAYLLVQIPWLTDHPLIMDAITKILADYKSAEAWGNLLIQLFLLIGVTDILRKNIVQGVERKGAPQ